jgi:hypothetical protein
MISVSLLLSILYGRKTLIPRAHFLVEYRPFEKAPRWKHCSENRIKFPSFTYVTDPLKVLAIRE